MENASKALLIAASVLIVIVIISAFVLMMSTLTDYQLQTTKQELNDQTVEFNNQYMIYAGEHITGYDMISLINKVRDYNQRSGEEGFTLMQIDIKLTDDIREDFKYVLTEDNVLITENNYDESVNPPGGTNMQSIDNIVLEPQRIEGDYGTEYARQFVSEISNIEDIVKDSSLSNTEKLKKFNDAKYWNQTVTDISKLNKIYEDARIYYEFTYFKRAFYDCKKIEYDSKTGRIIHMEFECTGMG